MKKKNDLVSVVMLSYNRKNDVKEGVKELLNQAYKEIEIIVIDNGSTDNTIEMLRQEFPEVNSIELKKNIGIAAYNIAFNKAKGNYVVILDDDSFPESNAITRMVEEFSKNKQLGIVAFDVRNYYDYQKTNAISSIINDQEKNKPSNSEEKKIYQMAFNGAGVGIRKSCIEEVGGYPEEFFLYWNEQDLSIRVLKAGYLIQWFPDIISLHKYSPANRESRRAPFYYTRNLYWLIWKYFPLGKVLIDTFKLLYYSLYYSIEQKTTVYLEATMNAILNISKITRQPAQKKLIFNLRLTYRLAFIYFK